ncbi:MAG: hypothetical protein ACM34I_03500 [bacterium]
MGRIPEIVGGVASVLIGLAVFKFTGLYDACTSDELRVVLGFGVMAVYLIAYLRGLLGRPGRIATAGKARKVAGPEQSEYEPGYTTYPKGVEE